MSLLNLIVLLVIFLVLSGFFAAGETALFALPRLRLRRLSRHGVSGGLFREMVDNPHRVLVRILLGSTLANVAATSVSALIVHRVLGTSLTLAGTVALQVLATSFVLLVFCELAPKTYALQHAEPVAIRLAPALRLVGAALRPAVNLLEGLARATARLFGGSTAGGVGVEDLKALLEEGKQRGALTAEEAWLFDGAFRLRVRTAADVMTPRSNLVLAPSDASTTDLVELFNLSGHARIPVYEHTIDRVVGVVDARDILPFALEGAEPKKAREVMRPPLFVAPERPVEALLRDLQRARVQFVIVGAEGQEALGVVTVEDILEEIIGDIRGEFEEEEPAVRLLEDGSAVVRGDVRVSDVNRLLGTTLPSADGETVEALVRDLWREAPPSEGDETKAPSGDRLGIESLVGSRVWSVRVRRGRPVEAA